MRFIPFKTKLELVMQAVDMNVVRGCQRKVQVFVHYLTIFLESTQKEIRKQS